MVLGDYETYFLYLGVGLLVAWMCYIMYKLAKESGAGRLGTVAIFAVLGLGIFGFLIKTFAQFVLEGRMN